MPICCGICFLVRSSRKETTSHAERLRPKLHGGGRKESVIRNEVHQEEEEPIQRLPDVLISYVLSKLSNSKDVAMASMVCKGWYNGTRHVQHLSFSAGLLALREWAEQPAALGWFRLIGRSGDLRKLCICADGFNSYGVVDPPSETYILECLRHTNPCLETLHLNLSMFLSANILNRVAGFQNLVELQCHNTHDIIDFFPGTCKFMTLKKCKLSCFSVQDWHLEEFLFQCPVLEELNVSDFTRLKRPTLTSGSLRKLEFIGCGHVPSEGENDEPGLPLLKLNAPLLASLVLQYVHKVVCDSSDNLQEIHFKSWVDPCFKHLPRLHKLSIEGTCWLEKLLVGVLKLGSYVAHVSLVCSFKLNLLKQMPAEMFFYHVSQVETLEICSEISEVLLYPARSTTFRFSRLRRLYMDVCYCSDGTPSKEALLKFLLDRADLKVVVIFLQSHPISRLEVASLKSLLNLQSAHPQVAFDVQQWRDDQEPRECSCCIEFDSQTL